MAAGQGFKTFATGDVLTAADTNGYLMQGVWVFANAAARDAAVTSPQEGNMCFLKDTDVTQFYTGAAWSPVGGSGGMTLLSTTTLSGTSTSVSVTATGYKNLVAYVSGAGTGAANYNYGVRVNSITANYVYKNTSAVSGGTILNTAGSTSTIDFNQPGYMSCFGANTLNTFNVTIWDCNSSRKKLVTVNGSYINMDGTNLVMTNDCVATDATSAITNITVISNTSLTSGTIEVYGVK